MNKFNVTSKFLLMVSAILLLTVNLNAVETNESEIKIVSAMKANALIEQNSDNPKFVIVDVRTNEEYKSGHISNSINIDYESSDFKDKLSTLAKDKTYITYCRSGRRSTAASEIMLDMGYEYIYMIAGGIDAWDKAGLPTTK